jgi:general secretion pathway protein D
LLASTGLALVGVTGGPASAQDARGGAVTAIRQLAESPTQSVFKIVVSPRVGRFEAKSDDPGKPALEILQASKGAELPQRPEYKGLVRAIDIEPGSAGLTLRFIPTAPSKIKAVASGTDGILVTIDKLAGAEALGSRPVNSDQDSVGPVGPLPTAKDPAPGEDGYEMVFLKYADVSEVVGLLSDGVSVKPNNVFIRREPGFGSLGTGTNNNYQAPQPVGPDDRPLGQAVDSSIAIDRRLNAIWVKGSPERIARVKAQIALIDVPVDSVILETQFVELTEQGAKAVGFDFTNANGQIGVGTVQYGQYVPFGLDPKTVQPSFSFQAALYAQVQKGEGRIVSRPRIAAQSGSTAKIITGDALPILTSITLSGVNGVSQQVQYVNVGVTLQIAPRVSPDGYVSSHIYGVVSSVTGYSQGYPTISQREAETSASVRDGETFVIGGLTQENSLSTKSKVPILGDIPLLGQAFKNQRSTRSKTELYIVITPRIVRHRRFEDGQQPVVLPTDAPPQESSTKKTDG